MSSKIKIINGKFSYGKNIIFNNLNIEFFTDRLNLLKGFSGSGKTTLLKIIAGKLKLTSGILQSEVKNFSFAYQDIRLLPYLSARENICLVMPKNISKNEQIKKADYLLEVLALSSYKNFLPAELSGGMQRRVGLARALAFDAKMYLLDEVFESLDEETIKIVTTVLLETLKKEGRGAICVTHKVPADLENCYEVVL
ncbi:MAG: ATP-binding cassette domain-containing protein [Treponemataceae bacterium]